MCLQLGCLRTYATAHDHVSQSLIHTDRSLDSSKSTSGLKEAQNVSEARAGMVNLNTCQGARPLLLEASCSPPHNMATVCALERDHGLMDALELASL